MAKVANIIAIYTKTRNIILEFQSLGNTIELFLILFPTLPKIHCLLYSMATTAATAIMKPRATSTQPAAAVTAANELVEVGVPLPV
jgi:hypothetical protein